MRLFALAVATLSMSMSMCAPALAADTKPDATQRSADPVIARQLDSLKYQYQVDDDGDYKLTFDLDNGRTQLAFVISALSAIIAGILLSGSAGVSPNAGGGYEFQAISAVVLGGAVLGGGRGAVIPAMAGALTLEALFTLLNLLGLPNPIRDVVQGVIIIAAVGIAAFRQRSSR